MQPPIVLPPIIVNPPPVNPPPVTYPPPVVMPPVTNPPPPVPCPPPATQPTCPIGGLKLGACVDVLGGLVHVGIGNPVENVCCPVIKGLLEIEAAVCLCTSIRLKLLNINIFIPLALQALITCGKTPPPGFVCPPL
ncbi:36.4 kDa proline-rich protein [Linum grandiflorum]